jgi:two-component system, sensor histidine kinase and response regulator
MRSEPEPVATRTNRSDADFEEIVESLSDGIVIVDSAGLITLVNDRTEAMFGYDREELLGLPVEVLLPARARPVHVGHRDRYAEAPRRRAMGAGLELRGLRHDGTEFAVDIGLRPLATPRGVHTIAVVRDASERDVLAARLAYLAAIVESSDDAIYSQGIDGLITSWNHAAERLFGTPAAEALGRPGLSLFAPHRSEESTRVLARVLSGERVDRLETVVRRRDGMYVEVSIALSPIVMPSGDVVGASAIVRDVTEQHVAQATLAESEARLREGESLAHVGGWAWDEQAGTVQWSDEMHRIHGISPMDFGGMLEDHVASAHPEDQAALLREMAEALAADRRMSLEYRVVRPDGSIRWVYARADALSDEGAAVRGLRGICQDITERHDAEEASRQAYERERAAAEDLRAAAALKDEFLATVSHELRTPLTAIMGFASFLTEDSASEQRQFVEAINRNAAEMARMIERLLDFSRLQAGRVHLEPGPLLLHRAVEHCLAALAPVVGRHRVEIDIAPEITVIADPDAIDRIMGNLVTNAAKFSAEGTLLAIRAEVGTGQVRVSVRDEGPGVPVDLRPKVFDPFFQAPDQPVGKRGAGVGLGIVKRYVELQGGEVWCEGEPGEGATFVFTLPLQGDGS